MVRKLPVFFYGLFMDDASLRAKGASPDNIRPAAIRGYALKIGRRAAVVPEPGSVVHGVVMDLTHDELDQLYSEDSLKMYRAEPLICDVGAEQIAALCFNLPVAPATHERNDDYARQLKALATRLGLPADYVGGLHKPD